MIMAMVNESRRAASLGLSPGLQRAGSDESVGHREWILKFAPSKPRFDPFAVNRPAYFGDSSVVYQTPYKDLLFPGRVAPRVDPHHAAIELQITALRDEAAAEGLAFEEASAAAMAAFCHELAADIEPAIFRLANGNLRAIWRSANLDQIGVQAMPNGDLQYIILRTRVARTLTTMGIDCLALIKQLVSLLDLSKLWYHG